jgi:signal transduction histidine kinase
MSATPMTAPPTTGEPSRGPWRPADVMLATAVAAITQAEVWVFSLDDGGAAARVPVALRVVVSLLTLAASGSLALRRTRPGIAFWVNTVAVYALIAVGYPSDVYQWTSLVVTYSVAAHGSRRQAWVALLVAGPGPLCYFVRFPFEGSLVTAAFVTAIWVVGWLTGRIYGARAERDRLRSERDLARRLADANEERLAHEEERNRIARELHDIIGHTVNVMVVHAGAGRRAASGDDGDTVRQAFVTIEETGRAALSELDRVLAVLRRDDAEREALPPPGLGDLEALATTFTDTGLRVDVEVAGDAADVPASVGLAAYRIVQEALTNTMKHASARAASVRVGIAARHLDLRVADDGDGDPSRLQPGRGIIGMTERAAVHGGRVGLDRDGDGGLVVTARLAWEASP